MIGPNFILSDTKSTVKFSKQIPAEYTKSRRSHNIYVNHSTCHCVRVPYDLSRSMWAMACNISVSFYPSRCKINSERTHAMDVMLCAQSLSTYICASTLYGHTYRHMRAYVTHNPCTDHKKHIHIHTDAFVHSRIRVKSLKQRKICSRLFAVRFQTSHTEPLWCQRNKLKKRENNQRTSDKDI